MGNILRFLLSKLLQQKGSKSAKGNSGFTLVELLVSTIVAFLIITPLLAFVMNILETERKEQTKAATDQEVQAAIDYMGRDLSQAVYIYDGEGLAAIDTQLPHANSSTKVPVLVFWKRNFVKNAIPFDRDENDDGQVDNSLGQRCQNNPNECDDGYVYSLVAYYVIGEDEDNWSNAARIARVEIKDAVRFFDNQLVDEDFASYQADPGYNTEFILTGVANEMNAWESANPNFEGSPNASNQAPRQVLVDYVDQTPIGDVREEIALNCEDILGPNSQKVPPDDPNNREIPAIVTQSTTPSGFYGCVNREKTLARIFIRGNTSARRKASPDEYLSPQSNKADFRTLSIQVQGRGLLGQEN